MNKCVLFADDSEDVLVLLNLHFKQHGWKVILVSSGNEAFEKVEKGGIDLVVSDLRMPNGTGIELLRKLKRRKKAALSTPPIIIMTGMLEKGDAYLRKLGAVAVLMKPIHPKELLKLANKTISEGSPHTHPR